MKIPIAYIAQMLGTNIGRAQKRLKDIESGGYVTLEDLTDWVEETYRNNTIMYHKLMEYIKRLEEKEIKEKEVNDEN